jgi:hypothetical protein
LVSIPYHFDLRRFNEPRYRLWRCHQVGRTCARNQLPVMAVLQVTETWMRLFTDAEWARERPQDLEGYRDRTESLLVCGETFDRRLGCARARIERDPDPRYDPDTAPIVFVSPWDRAFQLQRAAPSGSFDAAQPAETLKQGQGPGEFYMRSRLIDAFYQGFVAEVETQLA